MSDYFIFDDIDTRNYEGIYVYFDDVDATPSRVGKFIDIPGRNGSLYLDKGRFEDVTHTYDIIALTKEVGNDLINAIVSKVGYHRLEDSFNPDEFYSAVFVPEIEPTVPTDRSQMAFKLMFTRKPQRFLTSGETLVTVANNGTITNPTQFDSQPVIQVEGYGTLTFNGYEVTIENAMMGEVDIVSSVEASGSQIYINNSLFNTGDAIHATFTVRYRFLYNGVYANEFTVLSSSGVSSVKTQNNTFYVTYSANFTAGTNATRLPSILVRVSIKGTSTSDDVQISPSIAYYSTSKLIDMDSYTPSSSDFDGSAYIPFDVTATADSTIGILGNPTYIDCEIGEAYKIVNNQFVSLNRYIDLGSDLPVLASGTNTFTKSNTITSLKVKPNWWKL